MDCFRSGLDWAPGVGAALEGLFGGGASDPKKSNPNNESAGLVCLGGAGSLFGGGLEGTAAALLDRWGCRPSSANRSCCGARLICDGPGEGVEATGGPVNLCEADRSIACFSLTRLNGTSSSPSASSVDGSGIGPSITHRFASYFVRIKFSILVSDGTCPGANFASQYLFALALPHFSTLWSCSSVQASRSTDLTLLICVPIPLWMPEHLMQTKMPKFQLAHLGSATLGISK